MEQAGSWITSWQTVPAWWWNEHHEDTTPAWCEWVLVGSTFELDGTPIASMGFALTSELLASTTMDDFIDEVAFVELLAEVGRVRPVGDIVVNFPGAYA